jgi:hypothetical protein
MNKYVYFSIILGVFVMWIIFLGLLNNHAEYIRDNPLSYGTKKLGIDCVCTDIDLPGAKMLINSSGYIQYIYPQLNKTFYDVDYKQLESIFNES